MGELPEDNELLSAVRDAGWLLEHHAVRVLDAADMHPRAGWAFADSEEPTKSRELDVWSFRQFLRDEPSKVAVTARFLVECKQSRLPYVGIGYDLPDWRFRNPSQHALPRDVLRVPGDTPNSTVEKPAWNELGFRALSREHGETNFRVTQLARMDRRGKGWEAKNDGVFTSLVYPLAKAVRASQKGLNGRGPQAHFAGQKSPKRGTWLDFGLHFPVVLISCPLYIVDATRSEPLVRQEPWATATRELKSETIKGTFEFDIVTEEAFADYVAARMSFAQALADMVGRDPLEFTGERG